jgi:FKBP-type peptidyl-prolyl cis-trans isomerase FkpA
MNNKALAIAFLIPALAGTVFAKTVILSKEFIDSNIPRAANAVPALRSLMKDPDSFVLEGVYQQPAALALPAPPSADRSQCSAITAPSAPTKTASGLEYWDIRVGSGAIAQAGQHVKVSYTGWLTNGKQFDSSVGTGRTFDFVLGTGVVTKGWDEGIAGMKVGGKRKLCLPPELAYGAAGYPPVIPANSTLIFDVQLVDLR